MDISKPLRNLIKQAQAISVVGTTRYFKITATIITPDKHIPVYLVSEFKRACRFGAERADDYRLTCQIQPGLYMEDVVPYSDDLKMEVVSRSGLKQTSQTFRMIPLVKSNPEVQTNDTKTTNLKNTDELNLITVNVQLQELGYSNLRNAFTTDSVFLMSTTAKALQHALITDGKELGLSGADAWRGVDMPEEGDNVKVYKHIEIPDGTRLMDLPSYLQNDDKYGVYSKGLGCYYRKGMFYVYPLFKMGRYATASKVLDIFRFPEDAVPTLETTYYTNDKTITILSTGKADHRSTVDINRQNEGVGKRVISPDALSGKAGKFYANGNAITTRSDSISEYQTATRASGEQISTYGHKPAENICKSLSENALNDGEFIKVPWDQSNIDLIVPGMPCKYFYTKANDILVELEGVVIDVRTNSVKNDMSISPTFRESANLIIFVQRSALDS